MALQDFLELDPSRDSSISVLLNASPEDSLLPLESLMALESWFKGIQFCIS